MKLEMSKVDAIRFYYFWKEYEEKMYKEIVENNSINAFKEYLNYMKITRNFKKDSSKEILIIANQFKLDKTVETVNKLSAEIIKSKMQSSNQKELIVASSKIMWLFDRDFYIIQDNLAKNVLEIISSDNSIRTYGDYCANWNKQYSNYKKEIKNIIEQNELVKTDSVFKEEWFIKRIFDMKLWHEGKLMEDGKKLKKEVKK